MIARFTHRTIFSISLLFFSANLMGSQACSCTSSNFFPALSQIILLQASVSPIIFGNEQKNFWSNEQDQSENKIRSNESLPLLPKHYRSEEIAKKSEILSAINQQITKNMTAQELQKLAKRDAKSIKHASRNKSQHNAHIGQPDKNINKVFPGKNQTKNRK